MVGHSIQEGLSPTLSVLFTSSNYDKELSLTGERGITKPSTKNPQARRLVWKSTREANKKARPFLWEWICTVSSGT
jgi:hypothetical protein